MYNISNNPKVLADYLGYLKQRKQEQHLNPPKPLEAGGFRIPSSPSLIDSYISDAVFFRYQKTSCSSSQVYSQHRRQVKSINRLNYLQYTGFDFGNTVFLTLTINNKYINNDVAIVNARNRIQRWLRRRGIKYYIIAKEYGTKNNRLHYHLIIFQFPEQFKNNNRARKYKNKFIAPIWHIGWVDLRQSYNKLGGVFYVVSYLKKGANLQFSRSFFKERLLNNNVYYLVSYDKNTKQVGLYSKLSKIFGAYVSKQDYKIFTNKLPAPVFDLYSYAWRVFNSPPSQYYLDYRTYLIYQFRLAQWDWSLQFLDKYLE